MAYSDSASSNGKGFIMHLAQDHAVLDMACEKNALILFIEAEAIASKRGSSKTPSVENAQKVFVMFSTRNDWIVARA